MELKINNQKNSFNNSSKQKLEKYNNNTYTELKWLFEKWEYEKIIFKLYSDIAWLYARNSRDLWVMKNF